LKTAAYTWSGNDRPAADGDASGIVELVYPLLNRPHHPAPRRQTEESIMANPNENVNKDREELEIDPEGEEAVSDEGAENPNRQRAQGEQQNQQKQQKGSKTDDKSQTQQQKGGQSATKPQSGQGQKGGGGR